MNILFSCTYCNQYLETDSVASYFSFRCPTCNHVITVPPYPHHPHVIKIDPRDIIVNRDYKEGKIPTFDPYIHNRKCVASSLGGNSSGAYHY